LRLTNRAYISVLESVQAPIRKSLLVSLFSVNPPAHFSDLAPTSVILIGVFTVFAIANMVFALRKSRWLHSSAAYRAL
jgi:hypothetical protein